MKHLKKLRGLLLLLPLWGLGGCSLLPDTLPAETQNGAETFGCLVNGKIFTASKGVRKDYDGGVLIGGINSEELSVLFSIDNVDKVGTYYYTRKGNLASFALNGCSYGLGNIPLSGKVEITKFERGEDKANNLKWLIVSGRFEGVIVSRDLGCKDTTKITQGRFDVKFN